MNDCYYLWVEDVKEKTGCDPTSVPPRASRAGGAMAPSHHVQTWHLLEGMPTGVSFINTIRTAVLEQKTAVEGSGSYETSPAYTSEPWHGMRVKQGQAPPHPAGCRPPRLPRAIPASQGGLCLLLPPSSPSRAVLGLLAGFSRPLPCCRTTRRLPSHRRPWGEAGGLAAAFAVGAACMSPCLCMCAAEDAVFCPSG